MHYRNGREAKPGDKILELSSGRVGYLYQIEPGSKSCNGRTAPAGSEQYVTLGDCVLLEDVTEAFPAPPKT